MNMKNVLVLVKRDFWEYRFSLFRLPLLLSLFPLLLVVWIFVAGPDAGVGKNNSLGVDERQYSEFVVPAQHGEPARYDFERDGAARLFVRLSYGAAVLFCTLIYIGCALHYAFSSLFSDRKNNSILFWRSMPVSESVNVFSKLVILLIVFPAILTALYWLVWIASIIWIGAWQGEYQFIVECFRKIGSWELSSLIMPMLSAAFYVFPLTAWALFVSALLKQHPAFSGIFIPLGILIVDGLLNHYLGFELGFKGMLANYLSLINTHLSLPDSVYFGKEYAHIMLIVCISGITFCSAAIWLRNNRYEI